MFLDLLRSETAASPARREAALAGLRAYQAAERPAPPEPMPIVARAGRVVVRDHGGAGPPVLFVPSLINPPSVLDLDAETSLLRWLAARGLRPLLLDWGTPSPGERDLSIAGHVETLLLPVIAALGERVALAGYCLGGTMALAAAAPAGATRIALIAAPWRFAGFGADTRAAMADLFARAEPIAEALGLLPMEVLQTAFWTLDPARTIGKFERFGRLAPESAAARGFVTLEDWANDGPPLTLAAGRGLARDLFGEDATGRRTWRVADRIVDPSRLACPLLDIVSTTDRIVPAATACGAGERLELALGHVGMVVGGRAKAALWEPLAAWLSR